MSDRLTPPPSPTNAAIAAPLMSLPIGSRVVLPKAMRSVRHTPAREVSVGGDIPFIHPKDPDSKQIQEHWYAEVRTFNLGIAEDLAVYRGIWQDVANGHSRVSEHRVDFAPTFGTYMAFMRWSDIECALPGASRPARRERGQPPLTPAPTP